MRISDFEKRASHMFEVKKFHDISVVGIDGELSSDNAHVFDGVLNSLSKCDQLNVVLNFSGLKHIDYKLVQRIAERIIEFQCDGGDLKMAAANGYVRRILEAMGLDEEVYASVEEALLSFVSDVPDGELQ